MPILSYTGGVGTTGDPIISSASYTQGALALVTGYGSLTKVGYDFAYWSTAADGSGACYNVGDSLVIGTTDLTLYAQWKIRVTSSATRPTLRGSFKNSTSTAQVLYDPEMQTVGTGISAISISAGLVLLNTTSPDPVTNSLIISTLDGSDLPSFTTTFTNNIGSSIVYDIVAISTDSVVISFTYTPDLSISSKFTAIATLVFSTLNVSKDIGLFAQASQPIDNVTIFTDTLNFGDTTNSLITVVPFSISGVHDSSLITVRKISGADDFYLNLTDIVANTSNGISFGIAYIPTVTSVVSAVWQFQYNGVDIGSPVTLTAQCSTYVPPNALTLAPAPPSGSTVSVCFKNTSVSYLRIEDVTVSSSQFTLLNRDIAVGHVMKPSSAIWFLLQYVPTTANYTFPKVGVTGTYF